MSETDTDADTAGAATCSRRDCRAPATWALVWNNPKVHTPDRRKTWLACDEHRDYLSEFLDVRGFLLERVPFSEFEG
ncbi:hypothetical protein [Halostreptopolyspora alba]|uniref:Acetone carboxylase n=1 Tax=Halostreptopolyspora alba TaxID=2487137 RepID=A0A3N0EG40_9ACTN|nr:hypothetical protein EFW17_02480 [Nocardiopsaceae bacterium YIM 96095]